VTSDKQNKLAIPAFVHQGPGRRAFNWQAAEHEWTRGETEILTRRLPPHSDAFDHLRFPEPAGPDHRRQPNSIENLAGPFEAAIAFGAASVRK
jgi:hypothetical protein